MIRKILSFAVAVMVISSCGNKSNKEVTQKISGAGDTNSVLFASLVENPGNYIDKSITVEGKVVHVCLNTGKKMFIVGDNPDIMLYISAGENMPKFPLDLVGSKVSVEGRLVSVVTADKPSEEKMNPGIAEAANSDPSMKPEAVSADTTKMTRAECGTEAILSKQPALADLMMIYNKHTVIK
jgi:hypothetical protein